MARETRTDFYPVPIVDQNMRPGAVTRLVVFVIVLTGAAFVFAVFREQLGDPFLLGMLGILAMIGVGFLFATAIGFMQIAPRSTADELSKAYVDSLAQGLVVTDTKGRVIYANRAYADMTGATSAADVKTVESLLSDIPEAASTIAAVAAALRDGQAGDGEFRLSQAIRPGSNPGARWYRVHGRVFNVPGHRQPLLAWQIADISRERAEQERFFLDLQMAIDHLDHAPAGFFAADPEGRITYINATLAEWLGVDLASFSPGALTLGEIVAGDGMALVRSVKADPGSTRNAVIDLDLATVTGEALPVRFMHRVSASREGTPGPARTIVLNRTQGEDSSADLRASEVRFTRFFNSTPMAIAGVDAQGRILRTNAPFLSLFSSVVDRDAIDRRIRLDTVIHERDRPAFAAALERAKQRQADIAPIDTVLPDNEERHMRFYVNAVADGAGDGAEEAAIVYAVETTEQKALELQMAQSQKMQAVGQLAGGIAHDFNNVLTAIIMASDLLLTSHRPSDPSFPDIMNIKQNANRAASLVRQLLAFSRKQTLRPEVLSLTDVLADIRMLLSRLVGSDVKLKVEHGRDLWQVKVDIGQFEQVVVNLAVNARDAMPDGGELTIRTRNVPASECRSFGHRELIDGDYVLVEVEDTGTGIDPDVQKKIFEPFFTTKEVGKGTGLGLSMVYGIIKQTGGFIFCDSTIGKGTTFRIFLPRHVAETKPEATTGAPAETREPKAEETLAPRQPEPSKDLSGSAVVLLVEDEDAVRMGGVRALTSRGYTVHEASSGVEALEIFRELGGKVDIVVSDVVMPEMDGPTLLGELRKLQPDIKFVFVSGYAEDAFARNLPADAHFGFLPKPFSLKQLASTVKDVLQGG
ncbi:MAG TPA: PAS domain-containing protein [Rhizobiales bacterium]|nr:PAS domain-containing protein [Hyphomicrobiales bacterium]